MSHTVNTQANTRSADIAVAAINNQNSLNSKDSVTSPAKVQLSAVGGYDDNAMATINVRNLNSNVEALKTRSQSLISAISALKTEVSTNMDLSLALDDLTSSLAKVGENNSVHNHDYTSPNDISEQLSAMSDTMANSAAISATNGNNIYNDGGIMAHSVSSKSENVIILQMQTTITLMQQSYQVAQAISYSAQLLQLVQTTVDSMIAFCNQLQVLYMEVLNADKKANPNKDILHVTWNEIKKYATSHEGYKEMPPKGAHGDKVSGLIFDNLDSVPQIVKDLLTAHTYTDSHGTHTYYAVTGTKDLNTLVTNVNNVIALVVSGGAEGEEHGSTSGAPGDCPLADSTELTAFTENMTNTLGTVSGLNSSLANNVETAQNEWQKYIQQLENMISTLSNIMQ